MSQAQTPNRQLGIDALRGRRAISPMTYYIALPGIFLISFEFELLLPDATFGEALDVAIGATLAAALVLLLADKTLLRNRNIRPVPVVLVLGVYLVCGLVRGLAAAAISAFLNTSTDVNAAARWSGTTLLVVAWLTLIGIVLGNTDRDRHATMSLRGRRAQLEQQRDDYADALGRGRTTIAALVDSAAGPAIEQCEGLMHEIAIDDGSESHSGVSAGELQALAFRIRDTAEDEVRSLSHMLESSEPPPHDLHTSIPQVHRPPDWRWFRRAIRQATVIDPIQPTAVVLTCMIASIPLLAFAFGFKGLVPGVLSGAVAMFVILVVARSLVTPYLKRVNIGVRIILLLLVVLAAGVVPAVITDWWFPDPTTVHLTGLCLRSVEIVLLSGLAWAVVASSTAQSARAQRELAATIAEIEWQSELLRQELAQFQRQAAEIVHGRVQGRIIAAAISLSMQAQRLTDHESNARGETQQVLESAIEILGQARDDVRLLQAEDALESKATLRELLDSIADAWTGAVAVRLTVNGQGEASDHHDLDQRARIAEIVREGISNAARHGAATKVDVRIEFSNDEHIVTITDNGTGVRGNVKTGLGLGQITRAGGEWKLDRASGGGAVLHVELPAFAAQS